MSDKKPERAKSPVPPLPPLPPLVELPVYRGIYCSQEMTDKILRHLWEKKPELVRGLVSEEMRPLPDGHDDMHGKACERIIVYLREKASEDIDIPPSRLGMLDLLYELSRRLRKGLGLAEVPVFGKPLASGPEGPFPVLIEQPIQLPKNKKLEIQITQELADEVLRGHKKLYS